MIFACSAAFFGVVNSERWEFLKKEATNLQMGIVFLIYFIIGSYLVLNHFNDLHDFAVFLANELLKIFFKKYFFNKIVRANLIFTVLVFIAMGLETLLLELAVIVIE